MGAEFSGRQIFDDVTLPHSRRQSNDKDSHVAALKTRFAPDNVLSASYANTKRRNWSSGVEQKLDVVAAGWSLRPSRKTRVNARFVGFESKVDDYFVDLPDWRAQDPTYGGQNFDWTRISSRNRKVYRSDLVFGWEPAKGKYLTIKGQYETVDRDAMNQTQTNYDFTGTDQVEIPSTPVAWESKKLRLKVLYRQRVGRKGNFRVDCAYTNVDNPYVNLTAMCEESLAGTESVHDGGPVDGRLYYFQRERYGNGTNVASQSHRISARGTYQAASRASVHAYVNFAKEKNDDLNVYSFDRTVINPGINLWTAPDNALLVTLGYAYNFVESNANLCPPIFDG